MPPSDPTDDPAVNAIRQALEALTDEELENLLSLRISFKPECSPEIRRNYAVRRELAREVLESRRLHTETAEAVPL